MLAVLAAAGSAPAAAERPRATSAGSADATAAAASAQCPRSGAPLVERFISADCAECWRSPPATSPPPGSWLLDWIVPSARGDDAPLAPAAPSEARERAERLARSVADVLAARERRTALPRGAGPKLAVVAGPAWHGYFGVQLDVAGRWPDGASGWIALVESVPAGTDGTPVPRQLVRVVAGPLPLQASAAAADERVLRALRWPETAQPVRLRALAWVESARGRIVAIAAERCPWPPRGDH